MGVSTIVSALPHHKRRSIRRNNSVKPRCVTRPFATRLSVKVKLWTACIVSLVLAGGFLQCRRSNLGSASNSAPNCYERAQSASVLIVCPDKSTGTGVIVRRGDRLFVWTAAHVVSDSDNVVLRSYLRERGEHVGHLEYAGKVIARNNSLDVALIWMLGGARQFDSVSFVGPNFVSRVGDSVYHVGNFWGELFDGAVSTGVISQVGVNPGTSKWPWEQQMDQTTSFVTYGSSGGGIFNQANDKVLGIIVGSPAPGVSDVNLFVPVRKIFVWAKSESLVWAMYGEFSPSEELLQKAADLSARERKLPSTVSPD